VLPDGRLTPAGKTVWTRFSAKQLMIFWRWMVLIRHYDQQCMTWQKQGRIMNYPPFYGQEAVQTGSVLALRQEDWLFPTYRDHGAALVKGWPLAKSLMYWRGRVEANQVKPSLRMLPAAVPIATHLLHAVGTAWAMQRQEQSAVTLALFGDGATSEGDFHEACNWASLMKIPAILLCQNNGYAISQPFARQSATRTVGEKASAYALEEIRIDGNDVLAVYEITRQAVEKGLAGEGPTLIEAVTYRLGPHTMSDNPAKYRSPSEVEAWQRKDPLPRFQQLLLREGLLDQQMIEDYNRECKEHLQQAWEESLQLPAPSRRQLFAHVYGELPASLLKQQKLAMQEEKSRAIF
jgi:pyruvate dehydrogenase E1 component alpha subunit